MEDHHKKALRKNHVKLKETIDAVTIADDLFTDEILTYDDVDRIRAGQIRADQAQKLLEFLPRKGPDAYRAFRNSLKKHHSFLVKSLDAENPDADIENLTRKTSRMALREPKDIKLNHQVFNEICECVLILDSASRFGPALGLADGDVAQIKHKNRDDLKGTVYEMLTTWKQQQGASASGRQLLQILLEFKCGELVDKLEKPDSQNSKRSSK